MNIASVSEIINLLTGGNSGAPEIIWFFKENRIAGALAVAPTINKFSSMWQYDGFNDGSNTIAAGPANPTGGIPFTNPAGGKQKWLLGIAVGATSDGHYGLYDRLLVKGSLDATLTTAQTVGGSITRNTGGDGNEIWVEIATQVGGTATTITASYTNQAGTAGRTTQAVAFGGLGLREAQRMIRLILQDGDTGVQSVQSITLAASTTTAGSFAVVIVHPIFTAHAAPLGVINEFDFISILDGIKEIEANACLTWHYCNSSVTVVTYFMGFVVFIEK